MHNYPSIEDIYLRNKSMKTNDTDYIKEQAVR